MHGATAETRFISCVKLFYSWRSEWQKKFRSVARAAPTLVKVCGLASSGLSAILYWQCKFISVFTALQYPRSSAASWLFQYYFAFVCSWLLTGGGQGGNQHPKRLKKQGKPVWPFSFSLLATAYQWILRHCCEVCPAWWPLRGADWKPCWDKCGVGLLSVFGFRVFFHPSEIFVFLVHPEMSAEVRVAVLLHTVSLLLVLFRDSSVTVWRMKLKHLTDTHTWWSLTQKA